MSIENKLREAFGYNNEKVDKRYPYAMSAINYYYDELSHYFEKPTYFLQYEVV